LNRFLSVLIFLCAAGTLLSVSVYHDHEKQREAELAEKLNISLKEDDGFSFTEIPAATAPFVPELNGTGYNYVGTNIAEEEIPLLVNEYHRLDEDYEADDLVSWNGSEYRLREEVCYFLNCLAVAAEDDGCGTMNVLSAYRPYSSQERLYTARVNLFRSRYGDQAEVEAARYVMYPGASEHQTGLCADVSNGYTLTTGFVRTKLGAWIRDHAHEYGFIVRYPKDKVDITKVTYEPWHIRYVGVKHATYIYEHGLCLEEYVEMLENQ